MDEARRALLVVFACCELILAPSAQGQSKIQLPPRLSCAGCRVERVLVTTLRDSGSTALLGSARKPTIAVDSRGRFYVSHNDRTRVAVFGPNGLLLRTIGREGDGPGEFRRIARISVTRGDTIRVYERSGKETVLTPSYEYVRVRSAPRGLRSLDILPDGRIVGNIVSGAKELVGLPLHLSDSTGRIVRSFGSDNPVYRAGMEGLLYRAVALENSSAVFAAHAQAYRLELWNLHTGHLVREFSRDLSWFKPWVQMPDLRERITPPAHTEDIYRAPDGRIWMNIQVADRTYWLAVVAGGLHGRTVRDQNDYLDSIFEVVDPVHGTVLASRRFEEASYFMRNGLVFSPILDGNDEPQIKIWRLYLRSPQ